MRGQARNALIAVLVALALQAAFWSQTRDLRAGWQGVPPVPSPEVARVLAFGDGQFLYRNATFSLQNMGDEGGRVTPLNHQSFIVSDGAFLLSLLVDGYEREAHGSAQHDVPLRDR